MRLFICLYLSICIRFGIKSKDTKGKLIYSYLSRCRHVSVYNSLSQLKGLRLSANKRLLKTEEEVEFSVSLEITLQDVVFTIIYGDGNTSARNGMDMFKHKYGSGGAYTITVRARDANLEFEVNINVLV